jgi:molybdate transport system permease protein
MTLLCQALVQSIRIAVSATAGVALVGIPTAYFLARWRFWGKGILETVLTMPLVLPPTIVGYFLLVLLGHNGWLTGPLHLPGIFWTWYGAALAAGIVAFPLLLLPARAAFGQVEKELEDVSRLMGANRFQVFWHVSLPLAMPGILAGILLAFARALGEFGATVMVLGIQDRTSTLPIYVYSQFEELNPKGLLPAVLLLTATTLGVIVLYNRLPASRG